MPHGTRRDRTAVGAMWLGGVRIVTKALDLATLLILTRFLLPQDFGKVAVAMSFVQITEAVLDVPLANVLVRLEVIERRHIDTLFTLAILRGVVIAAIMCAMAVPIAAFYGDRRLIGLVCALSIAPAVRGLSSPRQVELAKQLNFGIIGATDAIGKVAALAAAAGVAIATGSYWAIAVGSIVSPVVCALVTFVVLPYAPALRLSEWRLFRGFVGWSMAGQAIGAMNWQCDRVVLAKIMRQSDLGLFTTARDLAGTGIMALVSTMTWPVISGLSGLCANRERLSRAYLQVNAAFLSVCLPLVCGQAAVAGELVPLLLGERWVAAIPVFQAVSLSLIPVLYSNTTNALFYALDRTDLIFSRNFYDFIFRVPVTVVLALRYGWVGAVAALGAAEVLLVGICLVTVRNLLGVPLMQQLLNPWRAILSAVCLVGAVAFSRTFAPAQGAPALVLLREIIVGGLTYVVVHLALWQACGRPDGVETLAIKLLRRRNRVLTT